MIADVILVLNIDTMQWVKELKIAGSDHIVVLDYDYLGEPLEKDSVIYFSIYDIKNHLKNLIL